MESILFLYQTVKSPSQDFFHFILLTGGKQQAFCSLGTRVGKKEMVLTDENNRSQPLLNAPVPRTLHNSPFTGPEN